jgi:16S rRNA (cytosine967-C5)-methyltransferase
LAKASPRKTAWDLHKAVWADGAYANLAWPTLLTRSGLSEKDRRFATELAYGSLRVSGQLTQVLAAAGDANPNRWQKEVLWVLQLGAYQLLHMRTPAHAAVSESVSLTREVGMPRASGLVNAVLRKVSARSLDEWLELLCREMPDETACLAAAYGHPEWVVTKLRSSLEREGRAAEIEALLASHNTPARVTAALLPGLAEPQESDARTPFSPIGVYLDGDPSQNPLVADGRARIQDEGSQLAALVCARGVAMRGGEKILDMCSGPGGKTAVLLAEASATGSHLTSVEVAPHRAQLVRTAIEGFGPNAPCDVLVADATELDAGLFDRILLDAPCSGLGALRRRPEARWTKEPSDLPTLVHTQARLLDAAVERLAEGGLLTYVTCSPVISETSDQITAVLNRHSDMEALDTSELVSNISSSRVDAAKVGSAVQLWPHRHGTDAMFIQTLRKRGGPTG